MSILDRRTVLLGIAGAGASALVMTPLRAEPVYKKTTELKPGQFTWHPERSPEGPVAIIVSIPEQRVFVYRNGIRIGVSTCSTGAPGHSTPTGVFTILEKDKNHRSSTYNDAPMPNMNRLTWSGIALHAGNLPGYPASHGCIRLPMKFSELLFGITHVGTPVILAGSHDDRRKLRIRASCSATTRRPSSRVFKQISKARSCPGRPKSSKAPPPPPSSSVTAT
jgi:hypothetical protein